MRPIVAVWAVMEYTDTRKNALERFRDNPEVSVLIVGGGINGAGLFRELALQGVDVLLVDRSDFCTGASCASSRMIHGGLRYLEFGEFRLVRESVRERNLLLQNAPHCVRPLPTTIPIVAWFSGAVSCVAKFLGLNLTRPAHRGAIMVKTGLAIYDILTRKTGQMPRHKFTSRREALARRPALGSNIVCTATYYDAWITYPERLCMELLLDGEALCEDAVALNYVSLQAGAGATVSLKDELSGETFEVRPKTVVNATGAWIDFANRALGLNTKMIGGTKGAHLIVDNDALLEALDGEMVYFENDDGRVSISMPWLGKALMGSTDIRIDDPDKARCEEDEIDYMIWAISEALPGVEVKRSQIVSHFSGVRPLPYSDASATVQISRDHHCAVTEPEGTIAFPVYSMIGGKWTTFRGFAEQVTDRLLDRLGVPRRAGTRDLAIGGGKNFPRSDAERAQWLADMEKRWKLPPNRIETLLERYGTRADEVAGFLAEDDDKPLKHHTGFTQREIEFMLRYERIERLDDLVARRTAIALLGELSHDVLDELAAIMAEVRGWSEEERQNEVSRTATLLEERNGIRL